MNGLLWLLGVAAALLVLGVSAELAARQWLHRTARYYVWRPGTRLYLRFDPDAFPEMEPLARTEINRDGERGDEVPALAENLYRVLVAGGSPVEEVALDQYTSWVGALQPLLQMPENLRILGASRVHVGNIGRSGMTAQAVDLILERVLPRYRRLDVIVIMVGGNDVNEWLAKGAPPRFRPSPIPASDVFVCHPEGSFGWRPKKLAVTELLKRFRSRWLHPVKVREHAGRWMREARAMRARAKEVRTVVPDPMCMLDNFENHLRALLQKAKARADRVLLVRQPWFENDYTEEESARLWHGGVGYPQQEEVTVFYSVEVLCRLMALIDARALRVAEELGVEHLDLMSLLEPSLKNYYDFVHFTPAGAAMVVRAVSGAIVRGGHSPLKAQSGPGSEITMADKEDPVTEELEYQSARAAEMVEVQPTPEWVVERYAKTKLWRYFEKEFAFRKMQASGSKTILEFGSGEGVITTQLARLGFRVTAMDICSELIQVAEKRATLDGVRDKIEFVVEDILTMPPVRERFDCVLCNHVLHHVDISKVFPLLFETLKPGGTMVIVEPIAFLPWLQRLRDLVPVAKDASPGERALDRKEVDFILQPMLDVEVRYFHLFGRLSRFFPHANNIDNRHPFTKACMVALKVLDRIVLEPLPVIRPLSGLIVIVGKKPFPSGQTTSTPEEKQARRAMQGMQVRANVSGQGSLAKDRSD